MANRFPLVINNSTTVVGELQSGDSLNLSLSGIFDGAGTGVAGQVLKATGSAGVTWGTVGDVFLTSTQTLQNKTFSSCIFNAQSNTLTNIPNGSLTNSSININGVPIALGGTVVTPDTNTTYSVGTSSPSPNYALITLTSGGSGGSNSEFNIFGINGISVTRQSNGDIQLTPSLQALTAGTYLTGSNYDGLTARTWSVNAASANTVSTVVARDTNGDFEARIITATSFVKSGGTAAQFLKADGSVDSTVYATQAFPSGTLMLFQQTAAPTGWTKQTTHNDKALRVVSGTASSGGSTAFTSVFVARTPAGSVSVSGSNSGGSVANTTVTGSVSGSNSGGSVSNHTLTTAQIPSHSHTITDPGHIHSTYATDDGGRNDNTTAQGGQNYQQGGYNTLSATTGISINSTGGGDAHNHGFTNPSWSGSVSMNAHNHSFTNPSWSGSASFSGSSMDFSVQYVDLIIASKN